MPEFHPYHILVIGTLTVVGLIVAARLNAFLALIIAALVVSIMGPLPIADKVPAVTESFGKAAGNIGIVIAMAAVIGRCLMDSGAADRIVQFFVKIFGLERSSFALMSSGYVLSIPVFFDTVFYLLVPLARSMYRQTGKGYLKYLMAIAAGGAITHTLVPPTPGPFAMAETLGINMATMILVGGLIGFGCSVVGLAFSTWVDSRMDVPMRESAEDRELEENAQANSEGGKELPNLFLSALPIVLPVFMIALNAFRETFETLVMGAPFSQTTSDVLAFIGNPNIALMVSAALSVFVYLKQCRPTPAQFTKAIESSLLSGGLIILITAAGGSFGAMLKTAQVGEAIKQSFDGSGASGLMLLVVGYALAALLKVSQGSSTTAMIVGSSMLAGLMTEDLSLGYHKVYLATAIGTGSLFGSWMNDSGFWIFSKMGGLTETETLKSWTPLLTLMSVTGGILTLILAIVMPLV